MPRYSLRTLLVLLAIGPPMVAGVWWIYREYSRRQEAQPFGPIIGRIIVQPEEEPFLGIELPEE